MIVGRIINGFGSRLTPGDLRAVLFRVCLLGNLLFAQESVGITSSTCPVFVAEASPTNIRGKLVVLGSLCTTVGFCLANWVSYALFDNKGSFQWRFPLAFQLVFPAIVVTFLPLTVESPRWLLLRGRFEEARVALARLRGVLHNLDDKNLKEDLSSIQNALEKEREVRVSIVDAVLGKDPLQNIRRLVLRQVALQARKANMLFAKVPWVYNSEINSLGWRTRGAAAATATNWISGFAIVQFTKVGVDNLGWGFYLLFAGFCWSFLPIVFLFYPETSLRTLEDMDEIFQHHSGPFVFRDETLTQRNRPQAFTEAERRRITETSPLAEAFRSV
ncbi:hypothetical protein Daesc_000533 [Daldinia eschscholtzii]|uniref:Major facilitator superfamily (MFS) profile domain-containing protein n=1 Tax=Daldinia eschscholtzii TaxID=292717 RepID=A0AAX6MYQ7_9PEZI